jgi:stage V sporulation protein R
MEHTRSELACYVDKIEDLAEKLGLDYYPINFEVVPNNFMNEIAVYGLPVRMPHWSFGIRYIHQLIRQGMGHSRIFEVMFPGDPCHAYLVQDNSIAENTLVVAHVIGHADFAKIMSCSLASCAWREVKFLSRQQNVLAI